MGRGLWGACSHANSPLVAGHHVPPPPLDWREWSRAGKLGTWPLGTGFALADIRTSGRSGGEEVSPVPGGDGGGRNSVPVQEGRTGSRDVRGTGCRRRGRSTCRRFRNEAGQFISMTQRAPSEGQGACRRGQLRRRDRKRKVTVTTEATLFEMVALGKHCVQMAVEEWVRSYERDRELALLDLISFFVQCCGCEGIVTAELYRSIPDSSVVHKMTEKFDQETGLYYKKFLAYPWILTILWPEKLQNDFYPIVGPGPFWKRFRVNFCEFTELLVQQTHSSVLCDGHLMDTVICMLSSLTSSAVHSLRHTSSLAAMKLLTALAGVKQGTCTSKYRGQRLCELQSVSRVKGRHKHSVELLDQPTQQQNRPLTIDNIIRALFKRTFVPRYRDVSSDIRVICVTELGCWIKLYPDHFLDDNYLKYIGWMLYDKDASVRMQCILALKALYEKRESAMKLRVFFHKFKKRILSMTQDRQPEIRSECMQLLRLVSEHYVGVFSSLEYVFLFQFVYSAYRPLATAAGELICKRLLAPPPQEGLAAQNPPDEFERNLQNMKTLIDFYLQGEFHRHIPYLVDGLWDAAPTLVRNWECMTSLLLRPRGRRQGLTSQQEQVLIEILVAAVRQAAEGCPPTGRELSKKAARDMDRTRRWREHANMSRHFVKVLPQLLSKFAADKEKVTPLLQIPRYCNLDVYDRDGLGSYLDSALLELDCLVQRHSDMAVLEACARAYGAYCDEGGSAHRQATPACSRLVDMLVDALTPLLDVFIQHEKQGQVLGHHEMGRMCSMLRRLVAFYSTHDLSSWNLYEKMDSLLTLQGHQGSLPTEVVHCALQGTYYALLWQIAAATDRLPPQAALLDLRRRLMKFCVACRVYLSHQSKVLSGKAFILLCDLLLILSHQGPEDDAGLGLLFFVPDQLLQARLLAFLREHVFLEESGPEGPSRVYKEEDSEELHELFHRRNMLAVFCKLVVYNVLDMSAAAEVYQFYLKHYHHFGDILKETMTRTRQNDRLRNALSLLLCLQQLFQKHMDTCGLSYDPIGFICGPFYSIRLLARRFALTLGFDCAPEAAHLIHRRGLAYAFSEAPVAEEEEGDRQRFPNLSFLLLLAEFSCKIPLAERGAALAHFQDSIPEGMPRFGDGDMNPLLVYRKSLTKTDDAAQGEEEPAAANPFDAICKESKRQQELPVATCSTWTPDTLASSAAGDPEPRTSSSSPNSKRDIFDVDFLSEDSENSSNEDVDVEGISVQGESG
ncbi:cohesin subunit SA-2-like [Suricata suricatta]|uniref:cohesin subunit SA-2-like n=1 Tax=Suricata suricatta TaxID=37032 RepID=UPI0011557D8A|nr:cohesin subunit SA-2-like [Suricata suricatta]